MRVGWREGGEVNQDCGGGMGWRREERASMSRDRDAWRLFSRGYPARDYSVLAIGRYI